jgi:hypothetical protein
MLNLFKELERNITLAKWFKGWVKQLSMSPSERYLAQATDRYDLEYRLKTLQRGKADLF